MLSGIRGNALGLKSLMPAIVHHANAKNRRKAPRGA
jgi:hypothetical protein